MAKVRQAVNRSHARDDFILDHLTAFKSIIDTLVDVCETLVLDEPLFSELLDTAAQCAHLLIIWLKLKFLSGTWLQFLSIEVLQLLHLKRLKTAVLVLQVETFRVQRAGNLCSTLLQCSSLRRSGPGTLHS